MSFHPTITVDEHRTASQITVGVPMSSRERGLKKVSASSGRSTATRLMSSKATDDQLEALGYR